MGFNFYLSTSIGKMTRYFYVGRNRCLQKLTVSINNQSLIYQDKIKT